MLPLRNPMSRSWRFGGGAFPKYLGFPFLSGQPSRQHEQGIAQTVQENHARGINRFLSCQTHTAPLSSPADSSSHMQLAAYYPSARQNECLERWKYFLTAVHESLEPDNITRGYPRHVAKGLPRSCS